jgi:hypothetical protein
MQESQQPPGESPARAGLSRRSVLAGAGAGAAGLAVSGLVAAPALAAANRTARTSAAGAPSAESTAPDGEPIVVHVRDLRSGEMDIYRGTSHVRVTDRSVAAAVAAAGRRSS